MDVRGLATAASIWNTGAVGAAVALEREEIALVLSLINFVTLRLLTPLVVYKRETTIVRTEEAEVRAEEAEHYDMR